MYKPVILVILDGYGRGLENAANAIFKAKKPNIDFIEKNFPMTNLQASGIATGLPWGEEGNSEVGHLNLGAGQIVYQYLPRITFTIRDGSFFEKPALLGAADHIRKNNSSFHIIGLIGSGNVHSNIDHFYALLDFAKREKMEKVFIHAFTDGRDSPPKGALDFYEKIQNKISREYPFVKIASLVGRHYAMDRDNNWDRTEKAYRLLTEDKGEIFDDAKSAIKSDYDKNITDEFLEPKIMDDKPKAVKDGDAVVFIDFREDSARQLTRAFVENDFDKFKREKLKDLYFATMTRYEKDLPIHVLFEPLKIENSLAKIISNAGKLQLHIAETEKYAHVTYFFNGGIENAFPKEDRMLIPTMHDHNFEENPAMSAEEITENIIEAINSKKYDLIVANYANADMIGHTGNFNAAVAAVEVLDKEIGNIMEVVLKAAGALVITSDHGNADEMVNLLTGQPYTEHTANPVPFYLVANEFKREKTPEEIEISKIEVNGVLADVAPTILELMELSQPPEMTGKSLLKILVEK
ncbi:MAG: 2,3-bisphosphoglycerate-independent phosphoglycerate mutase [Candidatus Azambacteria bacterium]|nr:2,3-bisphosphoglycerate-independent phosphoglycerate mutase [Candidatus Azambacteria bacterium]